ncbi:hypothetical protein L6452_06443 [Arctium lappa]|uniref:Uncharacterized protein n=1 Tax=Arctium lappa TaxID=4217 RepID=A0ACB9EJL1_ARCLA|nr:hypothetical protein L6452_06443 [Arctium lappa]
MKNKARLVAQGYTQEEGIYYEEVCAPVARIEAIRLFLAYAFFMKFRVYQMDVKIAFLYGKIDEEVYVCQPPGFENSNFPDKVYKLKKALYGLHQAPRAWYDTLSTYLLENDFERGIIDKTLLIQRKKKDILLVEIYVDDIIFGSTTDYICKELEELMHKRFKMSSMGEFTFFLGLQCKKQTTVSTSTTEVEYIAAASYCSQVLWIQNQMLDYVNTALTITPADSSNMVKYGYYCWEFILLSATLLVLVVFLLPNNVNTAGPTEVYKFYKSKFSPQWRFFVHTLQHCLSRKTTGWSEFSSIIAYALIFVDKPIPPITQKYTKKKVQKVPSLHVSTPQKPTSPLMEHSPSENIQRESTGVSPNPKKVLSQEKDEHVGSKAYTTDSALGVGQDRVNMAKTFPTETLDEKSSKGPSAHDASTKGENQEVEVEKESSVGMRFQFEGEMGSEAEKNVEVTEKDQGVKATETVVKEAVSQPAAETEEATVTTEPTVETAKAVETKKAAAETGMSMEEIEIAEKLVKAKNDIPKATQKAKGVVINEGGSEKRKKEISVTEAKKKGKEKMVEPVKPLKKQKQMELGA